jgi:hypothetical protein
MSTAPPGIDGLSVDDKERVRDFLARHGGPSAKSGREGDSEQGTLGWYEIYAADGHTLRCDWSKVGGEIHLRFSEIAPSPAR